MAHFAAAAVHAAVIYIRDGIGCGCDRVLRPQPGSIVGVARAARAVVRPGDRPGSNPR